ncbi:MAG: translation initiation factor IF-2 [Synechococcales cyanobacterium RM1_1_8]|nr:translation initiation factor IF-2 [Synechococcales cyanobacterium RM1_1_8]
MLQSPLHPNPLCPIGQTPPSGLRRRAVPEAAHPAPLLQIARQQDSARRLARLALGQLELGPLRRQTVRRRSPSPQPYQALPRARKRKQRFPPQPPPRLPASPPPTAPGRISPPARPSAPARPPVPPSPVQPRRLDLSKRSTVDSGIGDTGSDRPVKRPRLTAKPGAEGTPPPIVELQRPKLIRPPSRKPPEADIEDTTNDDPVLDAGPILPDLERPRRLDAPSRPNRPSRRGTRPSQQEEEEEAKLKAKKANRLKQRVHIIGDDDDDDMLDATGRHGGSATLSQSLARPPKPKSMQSVATSKPTSTPQRKKKRSGRSAAERRRERYLSRQDKTPQKPEMVTLKGEMTVQDLADLLKTPEADIIRILFFKGVAATITQTLNVPAIELVCEELEILVDHEERTSDARKTTEILNENDLENLQRRPPVVTVMGHVDHGKTTLLDSIRKTKVVDGEAGGITQHIGAYHVDVDHNGQRQQIVFLDTPGHEAFTAMRARGTRVTDIAILVVAADDGVRPQTIEAISHAKAAKVPIIVAINKIDKEGAQPDRVKQELTEYNLVPEEWGGDTPMVPVSAIQGDNLEELLDMILLVTEVEELSANPNRPAMGTVIEANLDKSRGPVASLLVQNGTLKVGDVFVAGSVLGRVRAMIDDQGARVEAATPSFAVEVLGLSEVPAAGDEFQVFTDEKQARAVAAERANEQRNVRLQQAMASRRVTLSSLSAKAQEGELKELNLVLKSDVQGSLEAILSSLEQLPQREVQLRVLLASPGDVAETDVDLAAASGAVIIGFNTNLSSAVKRAADESGVDVREYDIIYDLLEDIQGAMEGLLEPEMVEEPLGKVEVRAVFSSGRNSIAGCYVQSGKAVRNCKIRVHRGDETVYNGNLDSLRRVKDDVKEVNSGFECGIVVDNFSDWKEGDVIETFRLVSKRRTLTT